MSTFYSQGDGNWSTTTNWDTNTGGGGTDPASGDEAGMDNHTFVIQANHTITLDLNMSAWANGIAGLTITSHATTPGMLCCSTSAGSYCIKIKTGTTIAGTNAATKGRILANSDKNWANSGAVPTNITFVISLVTTAYIDATYLDIKLYDTEPTTKYVECYGQIFHECTVDASGNTLTYTGIAAALPNNTLVRVSAGSGALPAELSANTDYWVVNASGNTIKLATSSGGSAIDLSAGGPINVHCGLYYNWGISGNTLTKTAHGLANATAVCVRSTGTLPTPLNSDDIYYVVSSSANAISLAGIASGAAITLGGSPSGTITVYTGTTGTSPGIGGTNPYTTPKVNVLQDVTGESVHWASGAAVGLVDTGTPENYDQQRTTLNGLPSATIMTLTANVDSVQFPMYRVFLLTRNVAIRSSTTSGSGLIVAYTSTSTHGGVFQCEIRCTEGTGTTWYGYAISYGVGHIVSGVISCCNYAIRYTAMSTVSGIVCTGYIGVIYSYGVTSFSGTMSGISYGFYCNTFVKFTGSACGCSYVGQGNMWMELSGTVRGCNHVFTMGASAIVSGTISGCTIALNSIASGLMSGEIRNCSYVLQQCGNLEITGAFSYCGYTNRFFDTSNMAYTSLTDVIVRGRATYAETYVSRNQAFGNDQIIRFEDYGGSLGAQYAAHALGDVLKETTIVRTGGASSSIKVTPLSNCGKDYAGAASTDSWVKFLEWTELAVPEDASITKTFYVYGTDWSSFPTGGSTGTLYFEAEYMNHASNLTTAKAYSTAVLDTNEEWTAFTVTFTPLQVGPVRYRGYLKAYESGAEIYVDAALYEGGVIKEAMWVDGQTIIENGVSASDASKILSGQTVGGVSGTNKTGILGASGSGTISKETGANARGGSGSCIKFNPSSTSADLSYSFLVPVTAATESTITFYHMITSSYNGTVKVTVYDSDDDTTVLLNAESVSLTDDSAYHGYTSTGFTPTDTGMCRVVINVRDGASSGDVYIDDITVS